MKQKKWNAFDISQLSEDIKNDKLKFLQYSALLIYVYAKELFFRLGDEPNSHFENLYNYMYKNKHVNYSEFQLYYDFVDELPYRICSEIYSNSKLNEIRIFLKNNDFASFNEYLDKASSLTERINSWDETFLYKEESVKSLENKLEEYKRKYDFVLLNEGFKSLYEQKKLELKERRDGYSKLGAMLICTPLAVIITIITLIFTGHDSKLSSLWYLAFPITTLMLFLFYFTRVGLQHVRSIQSQMMQLELRMALCQFIHNYAEDSETLHKKNKEGFEKFENIIFSPIVASDDKIPTTFDGMEQLAKLIEVVRSK